MRGAEWRAASKLADRALAGCRRDDRRRERGSFIERRQQPRDRPREERLAGTGRADEQQAVTARESDFEAAPGVRLPTRLSQVGDCRPSQTPPAARK